MVASSPLQDFIALRGALLAERRGDGGWDVCRALTEGLDQGIAALCAPFAGQRFAAVAVGGYGRGEQCLFSDVDIMLLHGGRLPERAVDTVLYPLWDAKLKVGHAVRTVKDAVAAAGERIETLTALLDSRCISGDATLVSDLLNELGNLLRRQKLRLHEPLVATERQRRDREPYQLLEANLKEGRGGLRTLQALHWQRRAAQLAAASAAPAPAGAAATQAHGVLLAVRNAVHAAAGRAHETYAYDLRGDAARWLGLSVDEAGRQLYAATKAVDRLLVDTWPEVGPLTPEARLRAAGEHVSTAAAAASSNQSGGRPERTTVLGRLFGRRPVEPAGPTASHQPAEPPGLATGAAARSPLLLAARALDRRGQALFTGEEAALIRSASGPSWDSAERAALLRILAAGRRGWDVFAELEALGWVERALPEWRHVVSAPQHAPFHLHPLDVHLWRTVLELQEIAHPDSDERGCPEVAAAMGDLSDALLAALLHDIGKGWEGDHSITGAEAAASFCRRARFAPATSGAVTAAIRHHLLLPTIATRRDIDDPRVISQVADLAGDLYRLRILFLLSVADSRATGPGVWSPWKAQLMRSLYNRTADELARRAQAAPSSVQETDVIEEVAARGGGDGGRIREHLRAMSAGYLFTFETGELMRHYRLVEPPPEPDEVRLEVETGPAAEQVVAGALDRPGLLSVISGVFALHNVSILDARLFSRADNVIIDSFHVVDGLGNSIEDSRWEKVRRDMSAALHGALDLEDELRRKTASYRNLRPPSPSPTRVVIDAEADPSATVIEVHCGDRIGLLHDITRTLFDLGLDIHVAKIDTMGRDVVDTFYVREVSGEPVRDLSRREAIEKQLVQRLG